jgi:hypothetical protein
MTDDDMKVIVSVHDGEIGEWKLVEFAWNNHHALRSCGRVEIFNDKEDARRHVKKVAMQAALAYAATKAFRPVDRAELD